MDIPKPTRVAESSNGLPEWSHPEWPEFQQAVGVLPAFPKTAAFQNKLDPFVEGVDELVGRATEHKSLVSRCRFVAEHCVPKGGAA